MNTIPKQGIRTFYKFGNESRTINGFMEGNQTTSSSLPIIAYNADASLVFESLPNNTFLNEGDYYSLGINCLIVKVSHERTSGAIDEDFFELIQSEL